MKRILIVATVAVMCALGVSIAQPSPGNLSALTGTSQPLDGGGPQPCQTVICS